MIHAQRHRGATLPSNGFLPPIQINNLRQLFAIRLQSVSSRAPEEANGREILGLDDGVRDEEKVAGCLADGRAVRLPP